LILHFPDGWVAGGATMTLAALTDLSGRWIDRVHARRPREGIMLDMDFNVSPTYGENEQPTRGCDRSYQSDLDQIPAPAPKDKQMAGARLTPERLLAGSNKEQLSPPSGGCY
jgi:hypothetical protein